MPPLTLIDYLNVFLPNFVNKTSYVIRNDRFTSVADRKSTVKAHVVGKGILQLFTGNSVVVRPFEPQMIPKGYLFNRMLSQTCVTHSLRWNTNEDILKSCFCPHWTPLIFFLWTTKTNKFSITNFIENIFFCVPQKKEMGRLVTLVYMKAVFLFLFFCMSASRQIHFFESFVTCGSFFHAFFLLQSTQAFNISHFTSARLI